MTKTYFVIEKHGRAGTTTVGGSRQGVWPKQSLADLAKELGGVLKSAWIIRNGKKEMICGV